MDVLVWAPYCGSFAQLKRSDASHYSLLINIDQDSLNKFTQDMSQFLIRSFSLMFAITHIRRIPPLSKIDI